MKYNSLNSNLHVIVYSNDGNDPVDYYHAVLNDNKLIGFKDWKNYSIFTKDVHSTDWHEWTCREIKNIRFKIKVTDQFL